jgi:hypothetical protein
MAMDQGQDVTIHLPDTLRARLERLASLTGQPLEGLIVRTLSASLPPLPDDLPPESREALRALETLDDHALEAQTRAMLSRREVARVTELRERQRDGTITSSERVELDNLLRAADLITLRKAYAAVLLKWRGHPLPPSASVHASR